MQFKKIAFRVDATSQIGTGHFMRCFALAEELKKQGADIHFISRRLPHHLSCMLSENDMRFFSLDLGIFEGLKDELIHADWLGVSQAHDANATVESLRGQFFDWMIVDHYSLDVRWESILRTSVKKIMVIDDLADRQHDCDILIDQNYYSGMQSRYNEKVSVHTKLLLGPDYSLLREEFRVLREYVKVRNGDVKKILIFFGGVDADNYTYQIMETIAKMDAGFHVSVVIGAQHPFKEIIENTCAKYGYDFYLQTSCMAKLMLESDFSIGAGGSASWERCCLSLPSLIFALADNQISIAKELSAIKACIYNDIGSLNPLYLKKLFSNKNLIHNISKNASSIVDGLGVFRVIHEMKMCV